MKDDIKALLKRYAISFGIAIAIVVAVLAIKGFFGDDAKANVATLSDSTFTAGILFVCFYGMLFVSNEGGFLGIGFILGKVVRAFIPLARNADKETYAQYRERKLKNPKKKNDICVLFVGLFFILLSVVFTVVWYNI